MTLLGPVEVRALAEKLGIRPTKKLGQNFVIDGGTVRRIVRVAEVTPEDVVIEIGPGLGSLTLALLPEVARVVAVEIDPALAAQLPLTVAQMDAEHAGRLTVVHADALKVAPDDLRTGPGEVAPAPGGQDRSETPAALPTALVANLPYNVSVPVLLHLLEILPSLRRGLVMVQAEVADRLAAAPGSRIYGVPSLKAAWYADVRRAGPVGRNVFWPAPNVDSGLVSLVRRDPPETSATREEVFAVVDAAFAQRRKTLRAALASWAGTAAAAEEALVRAGVQPSARGEQLGIVDFARIAENRPRP
ncbi:16S rRNA (adenine(1518)-N(6)/adenine(1519)-N(6))-dimethyltransferase RsmA [Microtetraspora niveoalba]|uniref:16S rRNA (adenine(1518)-N(6)/adenine(1519)-N(6))- dimethyltransferase RsmA n=1 Tax=Microtetraspora niveoalba TaxID=46175 RepID=UPI000834DB9B|nr:16S rRNA (adenine(1518)-N(6)/adenine(1519)-N(6))-dimethyltransferase RsmA [Microtetraspora niveoalba]